MRNYFTKYLFFVFLTSISFNSFSQPVFRWDVKTLTDQSGIDWVQQLQNAKQGPYATIEALTTKPVQFTSCNNKAKNTRRNDELRVVKLNVKLVQVKTESNDNDYHIVIQSLTNASHYMVAEIPDPATSVLQSSKYIDIRDRFTRLRQKIGTLLQKNPTSKFKDFPDNTIVTIYGVPYWDCKHPGNVSGASKDFREVHPVLEIE